MSIPTGEEVFPILRRASGRARDDKYYDRKQKRHNSPMGGGGNKINDKSYKLPHITATIPVCQYAMSLLMSFALPSPCSTGDGHGNCRTTMEDQM